jgi:hypothetical protein
MLKSLLISLGLMKAPRPARGYLAASSIVGVTPVLLFLAWTYRDDIAYMFDRFRHRSHAG